MANVADLNLIQINNFPEVTNPSDWIVVSDAAGLGYKISKENFKAFLGTVTVSTPKPISPADGTPELDGVYIPTVTQNEAGTPIVYANFGGVQVNTAEGGDDYGTMVQFLKNGAVYAKVNTPIPEAENPNEDKTIIIDPSQLQNGIILNDGAEATTGNWKRTGFLPLELNDEVTYNLQTASPEYGLFLYDENKVFLRALLPNTLPHNVFSGTWVNTYEDAKFIRAITLSELHPNYQPIAFLLSIFRKSDLNKLKEETAAVITKVDSLDTLLDQTLNIEFSQLQSGIIISGGTEQSASAWRRTDFIPISKNDEVAFTLQTISKNSTLFLYDENKVFLREMFMNDEGTGVWKQMDGIWVNTDEDVKFVRAITLNITHAKYQTIPYKFQVLYKSLISKIENKVYSDATEIEKLKEADLELHLADLLITRDEQIAKIEQGDYGIIVNGNDFTAGTQTERLKDAISFIKKMGKGVLELTEDTVTGSFIWYMTESLLMPSNFTLLIRNGVTLKKQNGIFDTLLRNDGIIPNPLAPYGKASQLLKNENIHIIMEDGAYINDLDVPKTAPHPITGGEPVEWVRDWFGWRTLTLLFANCKNYSVKGGNFNNGKMWSISNESGCENFVYDGIDFRTHVINGDGIDLRMGCRNFVIKNITGATIDDLVALTCLNSDIERPLPGQVGGRSYVKNDTYDPVIENGIVYNITGMSGTHILILLCSGELTKINNIRVGKISQDPSTATPSMTPIHSVVEVFTGYTTPYASVGQMSNIFINDVVNENAPEGALRLGAPLKDSHFNKINSAVSIPAVTYGEYYVNGGNVFIENVTQG